MNQPPARDPRGTEPIGNPLSLPKDPSTTRLYGQNPKGVTIGPGGTLTTVFQHLKDAEVDYATITEGNVDTLQLRVRNGIKAIADKVFGFNGYRLAMTSTRISAKNTFTSLEE